MGVKKSGGKKMERVQRVVAHLTLCDARIVTAEELKKHGGDSEDPWLVINGKVYAVKDFLDEHPGGEGVLTAYSGSDCSEQFEAVSHSEVADEILEDLYVGDYKK